MFTQSHIKINGKTLDNWLHFYLSEPRVWQKLQAAKLFCTETDLTDHAFSSVERDVYVVFIVQI